MGQWPRIVVGQSILRMRFAYSLPSAKIAELRPGKNSLDRRFPFRIPFPFSIFHFLPALSYTAWPRFDHDSEEKMRVQSSWASLWSRRFGAMILGAVALLCVAALLVKTHHIPPPSTQNPPTT